MKSVIDEGTAGKFMGSSQFPRANLVVVRHGEADMWVAGHCQAASWAWGRMIGKRKTVGALTIPPSNLLSTPSQAKWFAVLTILLSLSKLPFFP